MSPSALEETMWSDPLTPDEVNAVKYFAYRRWVDDLLATLGETIIAALEALLADLAQAQSR
ncbi:MAG: hypothetical protein OEO79_05930 [Gemmatimonadota bacterium]|nr:hypothetical protein [Gemmatimonadota bacterium]MDH3423280.1 hypothetical protein [Gemmatimonadota bacterium]